jgi:tetratricopeptide repeat protein 30
VPPPSAATLACEVLCEALEVAHPLLPSAPLCCGRWQTAPEEAYRKFDDLSKKHIANLRSLTKNIQDARLQRDQEQVRRWLKQYDPHVTPT